MKASTVLTALAGLVMPLGLAGQDFEGSVTYRMEGMGENGQIVHHVKGRNTRMEFTAQGQTMAMITDFDGSKMIMLMPSQKQWMDMKAMQERMAAMMGNATTQAEEEAAKADPANFDIVATGQKETIAGHECEHYVFKTDDSEVDVCAAKGMGWYLGSGAGGGMGAMGGMMGRGRGNERSSGVPGLSNAQLGKWREMYADGFFPLKVESKSPSGGMTMIVTSIERKSLPDSLFAPPPDYTEMKMPGG
jgi:hypothetical protein